MRSTLKPMMFLLALTLTLIVAQPLFAQDCCGGDKKECATDMNKPAQHEGHEHAIQGKVNAKGQASGATMGTIFTTETLYSCPMHKQVVTDNPEATCPLCNMTLKPMSEEAVTALRTTQPEGCPMCPIVKAGDNNDHRCDICKMKLRPVEAPKPSGMEKTM